MIKSNTCGSGNEFTWSLNDNKVIIHRNFKSGKSIQQLQLSYFENLNQVARQNKYISLGNNVAKLADGTEKDGIGTFLMNHCGLNSSEAQIASHIAAILCLAGVWVTNEKKRNIEFFSICDTCTDKIIAYYKNHIN